jgi:ribonucleoside-diphosphate reductase alpha chain
MNDYGQLSENAIEVLKKRYFLKDEDGNCIEDWSKLCRRVARAIAKDEPKEKQEVFEDRYYDLMYNLKFLPNSPTLLNAGKKNGQLSACVSGDTYVYCIGGLKLMKDIQEGDFVLTHTGHFKKVLGKISKGKKEVIGVYRGINRRRKNCNLYVTKDHLILQEDNKWVEANDIISAKRPLLKVTDKFIEKINFSSIGSVWNNMKIEEKDNCIRILNRRPKRSGKYNKRIDPLNNNIINSNNMAWFFGMYFAEGSINYKYGRPNSVRFTLHKEEITYIKKLVEIAKQFGINAKVYYSNHGNWVVINLYQSIFAQYIKNMFGAGFSKKKIPYWIFNAPEKYKRFFIQGIFDGDGHENWNGNVFLALANPTLIYQILLLSREINIFYRYTAYKDYNLTKSPTSFLSTYKNTVHKKDDIYKIEQKEKKEVFDIAVEDNHSFVAGDFICHNCYVLPIEDNMHSIMDTAKNAALIHQASGGTGFDFSRLRPKNSRVKSTSGIASGPVSFIQMYNDITKQIIQGNFRRGANLGCLRVDHPDILEFISCKKDLSKINNFNISVSITDKFMQALEKNEKYDLIDPHTNKIVESISAKVVFDKIVEQAYTSGEPGLLFIDTVNKMNQYGIITASNPCIAKGSLVNTPYGIKKVEEIEIGDLVCTVFGSEPVKRVEKHKNYPVFKISFSNGEPQFVTASHIYHCINIGNKKINYKKVSDLQVGDKIKVFPPTITSKRILQKEYDKYQLMGIMIGDGCYTKKTVKTSGVQIATNQEEHKYNNELKKLLRRLRIQVGKDDKSNKSNSMYITIKNGKSLLEFLNLESLYSYEKFIKMEEIDCKEKAMAVLDGLLASDGNVNLTGSYPQIRFFTSSKQLAYDIRNLLLMCGFFGKIYIEKNKGNGSINGRQIVRKHTPYCVHMAGEAFREFAQKSKCIHVYKKKKLNKGLTRYHLTGSIWKSTVTKIEPAGRADVYDLYCKQSDTYITSGYVNVGCGEQFIRSYESCNLGSINLNKYYDSGIDWGRLSIDIETVVRFLDSVVSMNCYPLKIIDDTSKETRKIGLGIMGLADILIRMEIPYGSDESLEIAEKVMKFIAEKSLQASEILAKEKGVCKACKELKLNRRNLNTTSIAPTGSISIIANASSGCEPLFAVGYIRLCMDDVKLPVFNNDFIQALKEADIEPSDKLKEEVIKSNSIQDFTEIPRKIRNVFLTAHDVSYDKHVKMQAILQKHVDSAISKTINLPHNATKKDVENAYLLAYKLGCKGVTVYRDGCRPNQVLSVKKDVYDRKKYNRTVTLSGATEKVKTDMGNLLFTVNKNSQGDPIEVLLYIGRSGADINGFCEGLGKLISSSLQLGVPIKKLAKQLKGIRGESPIVYSNVKYLSILDLVGRRLEDIAKEKEDDLTKSFNVCPVCDQRLYASEGCSKCLSCGYSKC